jgi:hypothetical protein
MLMFMRGLEIIATASAAASIVPFISAWEATGPGAQKYRETVKNIYYGVKAFLMMVAWLTCGFAVRLLSPLDPRPATLPGRNRPEAYKGLKAYKFRRTYRGRHFSGVSVTGTLRAVAA